MVEMVVAAPSLNIVTILVWYGGEDRPTFLTLSLGGYRTMTNYELRHESLKPKSKKLDCSEYN